MQVVALERAVRHTREGVGQPSELGQQGSHGNKGRDEAKGGVRQEMEAADRRVNDGDGEGVVVRDRRREGRLAIARAVRLHAFATQR